MSHEEFVRNCIYDWQQRNDDTVPLNFNSYAMKNKYNLDSRIPIVIPFLPSNVKYLSCKDNTILPELPKSLERLYVSRSKLPKLPESLHTLGCDIQNVSEFPKHLRVLQLSTNTCVGEYVLPELPENLEFLSFRFGILKRLPTLPNTLKHLDMSYQNLECLPELPDSLEVLNVMNNCLHELPTLPPNLRELICDNNLLTELPSIPSSVQFISYSANKFTSKPIMPDTVIEYYGGAEYGYKLYPDPPNDQNPIVYNA